MVGRKRSAPADTPPRVTRSGASRSSSRSTAAAKNAAVPDVYREMLVEARAEIANNNRDAGPSERPLKRKRPGERRERRFPADKPKEEDDGNVAGTAEQKPVNPRNDDGSDGEDVEFEDVVLPAPTVQTMTRNSDDDDDDNDDDDDGVAFEEVEVEPRGFSAASASDGPTGLSLDLSAHIAAAAPPRRGDRRKAISREERERRIQIHKVHLLCLLAHVERRNWWCNDPEVQDTLRPLLPDKTAALLVPRPTLNQFSRAECLRQGLQEARDMFRLKFAITERGLRRALWAEDEEQLKNVRRCLRRPPCYLC